MTGYAREFQPPQWTVARITSDRVEVLDTQPTAEAARRAARILGDDAVVVFRARRSVHSDYF